MAQALVTQSALESYGRHLAQTVPQHAMALESVTRIEAQPHRRYLLQFRTTAPDWLLEPNAAPETAAARRNTAKGVAWHTTFCTEQLQRLMAQFHLETVISHVHNRQGATQQLDACTPRV